MTTPTDGDAPAAASLADIWRNPKDPRWKQAFERIGRVFGKVAKKHPRITKLKAEHEKTDEIAGLLDDFWCHLAANRGVLEANRVRSLGALRIEAWRFLDRIAEDDGSAAETKRLMLQHLRSKKVVPALRSDARFEQRVSRGPWMLSAWSVGKPPDAYFGSEDDLSHALPTLPAQLKAQRSDQLPPLVDSALLPAFLEEALNRYGRPRRDWDLSKLVWGRLRPEPSSVFLLSPEQLEPPDENEGSDGNQGPDHSTASPELGASRERWSRRVDIVASAVVDGMPPQRQRVLALRLKGKVEREIASALDISSGTVNNELTRFRATIALVVEREQLDEADYHVLREAILSILEVEAFYVHEGGGK